MFDNDVEGSERRLDKREAPDSGIRPPKHLVVEQNDMTKAWKIWVRQFDWYAMASDLLVEE
jgi:hypothetical protein